MAASTHRTGFFKTWIEDIADDLERYGAKRLIPLVALCAIVAGIAVALGLPKDEFYRKPDISLFFITAIVTIDGFFLALSWNSFAKIYEIASRPKFSAFLRRNNLINPYFFQVDFIHATQIIALAVSFLSLVTLSMKHVPLGIVQLCLGSAVATSIYALKSALGAVKIMQDLVWYSAIFEEAGDAIQQQPTEITRLYGTTNDGD